MLTVPLKSAHKKCLKHVLCLRQGGMYSLICFKVLKYWKKLKSNFAHFGGLCKIKYFVYFNPNFLFSDCSLIEKDGICTFSTNQSFLRSLWFFENENFALRAPQNLPIIWNWTPKNVPDRQLCVQFQTLQTCAKSLHPYGHMAQQDN